MQIHHIKFLNKNTMIYVVDICKKFQLNKQQFQFNMQQKPPHTHTFLLRITFKLCNSRIQ